MIYLFIFILFYAIFKQNIQFRIKYVKIYKKIILYFLSDSGYFRYF